MKAPPPLAAAWPGKRRKFPRPTAEPATAPPVVVPEAAPAIESVLGPPATGLAQDAATPPPGASHPFAPPLATGMQLASDGEDRKARRKARRARLDERRDVEDFQREPERKGFYVGGSFAAGVSMMRQGFVPSIGHRIEMGGGISDRITLGVAGGLTGHQGIHKGVAGVADVVLQGMPWRGLTLRVGVGVSSHAPVPARLRKPGLGGLVGVGWEFRPLEKLAVALSVDYDARVRTDGPLVQALVLNLGLRAYLDFHKR
jgi:hypothetical protein